ncbi:hypothetical protein Ancab_028233 [Ancistrocladus abbreviatus]
MLKHKLRKVCSILELPEPPLVHFANVSCQTYLNFLQDLLFEKASVSQEQEIESDIVATCDQVLQIYLNCARTRSLKQKPTNQPVVHWILPLGPAKKGGIGITDSFNCCQPCELWVAWRRIH